MIGPVRLARGDLDCFSESLLLKSILKLHVNRNRFRAGDVGETILAARLKAGFENSMD
jgi:hypothetical protein